MALRFRRGPARALTPEQEEAKARAREMQADFRRIVLFFTVSIAGGLAVLTLGRGSVAAAMNAALWAFACSAAGAMVGFLFGIPRVLQGDVAPQRGAEGRKEDGEEEGTSAARPAVYRLQVNTNLEQISDWLTKIFVGVGLIELRRAPELLRRASAFAAQGIGTGPAAQTVATALIVYFVALGFLGGYLLTRLFLAGAFSRADQGTQVYQKVQEETRQQLEMIGDLQSQVVRMLPPGAQEVVAPAPTGVLRILWVDDQPQNNTSMVKVLQDRGIEVVLSPSTPDALRKLKEGSFDRIISDMGREEDGRYNDTAGIDLLKAVRQAGLTVPVAIHCSGAAASKYGEQAVQAGAKVVTPSRTVLLKALELE